MTPHRCPVCNGEGKIRIAYTTNEDANWKPCHACDGKGIVWGPPEYPTFYWYNPTWPPTYYKVPYSTTAGPPVSKEV